MKKLGVFIVVFCSLAIFGGMSPHLTLGCAGPDYEDQPSFFEFSLANDLLFHNYHYFEISPPIGPLEAKSTAKRKYYDNLLEWQHYFNNRASLDEIEKVIYDSKNKNNLLYILQSLNSGTKIDDSKTGDLAQNNLLSYLVQSKQTQVLDYIIYSKDCEPWVAEWDPWEDPPHRDLQEMQSLINRGLERYSQATSNFIKLRYAYQIVRLAQYSGQPEQCIEYYDHLVPGLDPKSIITYWAMGHKAGALRTTGKTVESLLLDSLIFDQSENMMDSAFLDFYIPDDALWLKCLNSTNNNHRKATLWMMRGLRETRLTLEPLNNMFELEPKSARLEMMLIREVNRVEQEYLTNATFFPAQHKIQRKDYSYVENLKGFALHGAYSGQVRQPGLWYLTAGYLCLIQGDMNQASSLLTKAETVKSNGTDLRQQITLVKNLISIATSQAISPQIEETSFTNLTWAGSLINDYNNQAVYRSLLILLGQKYLVAGDLTKAIACFNKSGYEFDADFLVDIYSTNADLDRMIAFMHKKTKNKFETLILKSMKYSIDDIHYIEATKLMRQKKVRQALALYQQIPANYWDKYRTPKPVKADDYIFNDPSEYDHGLWTNFEREAFDISNSYYWLDAVKEKKVRFYTRLDFATKVTALHDQAEADPKNADHYYFQIANGYFHTPFWGYNDLVWKGNLAGLSVFPSYPFMVLDFPEKYKIKTKEFFNQYGTRAEALKYYRKTIAATKDKELAAKCTVLAQSCQYGFTPNNQKDDQQPDWTFFKLLRKNYAETAIYQSLIKECCTFNDFLGK